MAQCRSNTQHSLGSHVISAEIDTMRQNKEDELLTGFQTPVWVEVFLDLSGISDFLDRIEKERERRLPGSNYQNPYPEIFATVVSLQFEITTAIVIVLNC